MLADVPRTGLGRTAASLLHQLMAWFREDEDLARVQLELLFWALRQEGDLGARTYDLHIDVVADALERGRLAREDPALVRPLAALVIVLPDGISVQWFSYRSVDRLERDIAFGEAALRALASGAGRFLPGGP